MDREHTILDAYRDFRGALKQSEVMAFEVLQTAEKHLDERKKALEAASAKVTNSKARSAADQAWRAMARDARPRPMHDTERRHSPPKDLPEPHTTTYHTSAVIEAA